MNNELTEKLYAEFPYLYRGHKKPPEQGSMCWGFECGDGWFQLIHSLSSELMSYLERYPSLDLEVVQVKGKFGSLRYSVEGGDTNTEKLIQDACERAKYLCELTGKKGTLCLSTEGSGKLSRFPPMVLCDEKAKELGYAPSE